MNDAVPSRVTPLSTIAAASMLLWISRTLLALLVSYPLVLTIRASGMSNGPEGDTVLLQPGSLLLLELLRIGGPWLASALRMSLLWAFLSAILELIPLAVALDLLWLKAPTLLTRVGRALRLFPKFVAVGVIGLLLQAALLLAASLLGAALKPALSSVDERLRSVAPLSLIALGLFACGWLGGVLDLARASLVRREQHEGGARAAFAHGLVCLRRRPFAVLAGLFPSVAGSALGFLAAAWLLTRLNLGSGSTRALALAFGAHQVGLLFAIAWRVRWLDAALELSADSDDE